MTVQVENVHSSKRGQHGVCEYSHVLHGYTHGYTPLHKIETTASTHNFCMLEALPDVCLKQINRNCENTEVVTPAVIKMYLHVPPECIFSAWQI